MTLFQKLVLRLLCRILAKFEDVPGTCLYLEDQDLIAEAEEASK